MKAPEVDTFWDDCSLLERIAGNVSGAPVLKGTRLPADALVDNVESFTELEGMTQDQAIDATLDRFPGTPGGKDTVRTLLDYQQARLHLFQP